jgi:hypothetical protein
MGTAYGFVTSSPDTRFGDVEGSFGANNTYAAKYVLGGTGDCTVSKIGLYAAVLSGVKVRLGIFEHDAVNDCPGALVSNGEAPEVTGVGGTVQKYEATYSSIPTLTGGNTYWLALLADGDNLPSRFADGTGSALYITTGLTYPTWPDDTAWHTHTDQTHRYSFYAVYSEVAAQFARPSSDVAGGTFRSIVVTAPFGPRVIA